MNRRVRILVGSVFCAAFAATATSCGAGQGPTLDELLEHPLLTDGCPVGDELARKAIGRSPLSTASVELTCGTNISAATIFKRVDTTLGEFEGKTPWAAPARIPAIGVNGPGTGSSFSPSFYFWQPENLLVEVKILRGSEIPAIAQGYQSPYRLTVSVTALAR